MRLTQYTDYSLRVLTYLAVRPDRFGTIRAMADAYDILRHHLMKVVQELSRRGYIDTIRGKGGGMRLRLQPSRINIGKVVRDMESELELVECFGSENRCTISSACRLNNVFVEALGAFLAVLNQYTLADLAGNRAVLERILQVRQLDEPTLPGRRRSSARRSA